jgi:DivIVA domain-containing protein
MAADPHTDETSTQRFQRAAGASQLLREASFPMVMRGYDRHAVDQLLDELLARVEELESRQTREGVVQKALDELGEETAGILQRAHETADDITSRSRAQADARLQRAEREAEILRRDADEYAEQVITDTRALWEERQRLIEDIRQLADDVLGTADDAIERLKLPEALGAAEAAHGLEPAEVPEPAEGGEPAAFDADDATEPLRPLDPPATEPLRPLDPPASEAFDDDAPPSEPYADDAPPTEAYGGAAPPSEPYADDAPPTESLGTAPARQAPLGVPEDAHPEDVNVRGGRHEADAREESGHTVELEALPGGAEDPADLERE